MGMIDYHQFYIILLICQKKLLCTFKPFKPHPILYAWQSDYLIGHFKIASYTHVLLHNYTLASYIQKSK